MKNTFLTAIVVALGLGATVPFVGWAQDQPQAQTEPARRGGRGFGWTRRTGGRMGGPMAGGTAVREVMRDLTDAQREQVKSDSRAHADRRSIRWPNARALRAKRWTTP